MKQRLFLPLTFEIEATDSCNMVPSCIMCSKNRGGKTRNNFLSSEAIIKIRPLLFNARNVSLHGIGEPLLNIEQLVRIIDLIPRHTYVSFNSNGVLLSKENSIKLIDSKLSMINVSLDAATAETYYKVRRNDYFNIIKSNLSLLSNIKKQKGIDYPQLFVNMVIMKLNLSEIVDFVKFAKEIGANGVYFYLLQNISDNFVMDTECLRFDYNDQMVDTKTDYFRGLIKEADRLCKSLGIIFKTDHISIQEAVDDGKDMKAAMMRKYFCHQPWETVLIDANGDVKICCHMQPPGNILGNLIDNELSEIWNNDNISNIRSTIINGQIPKGCFSCPIRKPRPPLLDAQYSAALEMIKKEISDKVIKFTLAITNDGSATWESGGRSSGKVWAGCRIFDVSTSRSLSVTAHPVELREEFKSVVRKGDRLQLEFSVSKDKLYSKANLFKFDIVYDDQFWFEDLGLPPLFELIE